MSEEVSLPDGWALEFSPVYQTNYYYHAYSDTSSWTRPYVDERGEVAFEETTETGAETGGVQQWEGGGEGGGEGEDAAWAEQAEGGEVWDESQTKVSDGSGGDGGGEGAGSIEGCREGGQKADYSPEEHDRWALPPGWTEEYSHTYRCTFYRHEETDMSSWSRPYISDAGTLAFDSDESNGDSPDGVPALEIPWECPMMS